jgi:predicted NAD-dependent protein-ADP-ribosyltransferase YbiA (DUF1768 family)
MDIALEHKFTQHQDLKQELLMTGEAELVEVLISALFALSLLLFCLQDSAEDAFWGVGKNGDGRNELGKALERLRAKLRSTEDSRPLQRPVILFYDQKNPWYCFANLSGHPVAYNGEMYPTSEHFPSL